MKFRKKPIVVDAVRWWKNGDHPEDYPDGIPKDWEGRVVRYYRRPDVSGATVCGQCGQTMHYHGWIDTLEGGFTVCPGDWVIKGVKGEFYPCKPDIFEQTYESVDLNRLLGTGDK